MIDTDLGGIWKQAAFRKFAEDSMTNALQLTPEPPWKELRCVVAFQEGAVFPTKQPNIARIDLCACHVFQLPARFGLRGHSLKVVSAIRVAHWDTIITLAP